MTTHRFPTDDYPTPEDYLSRPVDQDDTDFSTAPWTLDREWDHQAERVPFGMGGRHV